jgi:hypothetical protein
MAATAVVTPEDVMIRAIEGRVSTHALAGLLTAEARRAFFQACGRIEQRYTNECRGANDPCLESGCSMDGERCLQPILRAGVEYERACGEEWVKLFADGANRDASWQATFTNYDL